jgi:hypothetical protein
VQQQAEAIRNGQEPAQQGQDVAADKPEPARRRRSTTTAEPVGDAGADAMKQVVTDLALQAGSKYLRLKAVEIAAGFKENFEATDDLFTLADEVLAYLDKAA